MHWGRPVGQHSPEANCCSEFQKREGVAHRQRDVRGLDRRLVRWLAWWLRS